MIKKLTKIPPNRLRSKNSVAGIELLALSKELFKLSKDEFKAELKNWQERHKDFLNEKTIDENGNIHILKCALRIALLSEI